MCRIWEKDAAEPDIMRKLISNPVFISDRSAIIKTGLDITNPEHATVRKDGIMGRYYRMSKKVTEDQVKEILRETLELEDVEEAEYEAETQLLKIVTKDNQFAGVMTRVVNICSRIGKGAELSFAKFAIEG